MSSAMPTSLSVHVEELWFEPRGLFFSKEKTVIGVKVSIEGDLRFNQDKIENLLRYLEDMGGDFEVAFEKAGDNKIVATIKVKSPNTKMQQHQLESVIRTIRLARFPNIGFSEYIEGVIKQASERPAVAYAPQPFSDPGEPPAPSEDLVPEFPSPPAQQPPPVKEPPSGAELLATRLEDPFVNLSDYMRKMIARVVRDRNFNRFIANISVSRNMRELLGYKICNPIADFLRDPSPKALGKHPIYSSFVKMAVVALWLGNIAEFLSKSSVSERRANLPSIDFATFKATMLQVLGQIDQMQSADMPADIKSAAGQYAIYALNKANDIIDMKLGAYKTFSAPGYPDYLGDLKLEIKARLDRMAPRDRAVLS